MKVLVISFLLLASTPQIEEITFEVSSLKQSELPDDFPWQILNEGFAVLKLRIRNGSSGIWTFDPGEVEVFESGGKTINRAAPTEITPQLMKFYRGGQLGIYGEAYSGGRPTREEWERVPTVEPGARAGTVSVNVAQRLRAILEHYQLKQVEVAPGETLEGFLYLKSKKTGSKLSGSFLRFENQVSIEIP
ncbi:MAG: hypothetical protein O7D93_08965 [Acidobacteria bacterium]|nr:hypothetical protein [Acidobacteriota bacterium]MCZ6879388.1 hypothetical protein [Acidobacteriota bacterium]